MAKLNKTSGRHTGPLSDPIVLLKKQDSGQNTLTGGGLFNIRLQNALGAHPAGPQLLYGLRSVSFIRHLISHRRRQAAHGQSMGAVWMVDCSDCVRDFWIILLRSIINFQIVFIVHHRAGSGHQPTDFLNKVKNKLKTLFEDLFMRSADKIIAASKSTMSELPTVYHNKVHVIIPPLKKYRYRKKSISDANQINILYIGSIKDIRKNFSLLLESLRSIKFPFLLNVVHKYEEKNSADIYKEKLGEILRADQQVNFHASLEHCKIQELLDASHLYVQPSLWEGFGMAAAEAITAGCPVVASRVGGLPEAVEESFTGILFDPLRPSDLTNAINQLLSCNSNYKKLSENCKERSFAYHQDRFNESISRLYSDLWN